MYKYMPKQLYVTAAFVYGTAYAYALAADAHDTAAYSHCAAASNLSEGNFYIGVNWCIKLGVNHLKKYLIKIQYNLILRGVGISFLKC